MTFFRYIIIQCFAYVMDMASFLWILRFFAADPLVANVVGKLAGGMFAFIAHRNITFQSNHKIDKGAQARRFFMLCLLNIPLSSALFALLLTFIPYTVFAKFLADVSCVFFNYWINKSVVFIAHHSKSQD